MKIFECTGTYGEDQRLIIADTHEEAIEAAYSGKWIQTSSPEAEARIYCHADDTSKFFKQTGQIK